MHNLFNDEALKTELDARQYSPTTHMSIPHSHVFIRVKLNMALTLTKVHGVHHKSLILLVETIKRCTPCTVSDNLLSKRISISHCAWLGMSSYGGKSCYPPCLPPFTDSQETQSLEFSPPFSTTMKLLCDISQIRKLSLMYLYQKMKSRLIHCEDPMNCLCLLGNSAWLGWGKMFPEAFFPSPVAGWRIKFFYMLFLSTLWICWAA